MLLLVELISYYCCLFGAYRYLAVFMSLYIITLIVSLLSLLMGMDIVRLHALIPYGLCCGRSVSGSDD